VLKLDQFNYHLPKERIAQTPAEPRDSSRLLVLNRQTGQIAHHHFYDLPDLLTSNDIIVRNNTKVIPARILGFKPETKGQVELLLIKRQTTKPHTEIWECLTKPGLKIGQTLHFANSTLTATCLEITHWTRLIEFNMAHSQLLSELDQIGQMPLPPYIHWDPEDSASLRELYQTTYAKHAGAAAAPTAGLHFTPTLDEKLRQKGVEIIEVTLHVGLGTFMRVKTDDITEHQMHHEWFELTPEVATKLNQAKSQGKRLISVGTTTTRVLETCADPINHQLVAQSGQTNIYLYPPYQFRAVDAQITNFHEPKSTLIMMVSAFCTTPNTTHPFESFEKTTIGQAYQEAIQEKYRLLSFGDSMLVE
jgi:S-adenosylmethionine:tRNA ribosyltransferase-isomerase